MDNCKMEWKNIICLLTILFLLNGCYSSGGLGAAGRRPVYEDTAASGTVAGVGIESQDIASMTDRMMRDMLSTKALADHSTVPYVIIDDKYFINESSTIINKRLITERLMVHLNGAAADRMVFVDRSATEMVKKERKLKRQGVYSEGALGTAEKMAGADYRLVGKIMSQDAIDTRTGTVSRYHQISFKMVDLETGAVVWSGIYEMKKVAQDDIIYR